MTRVKSAFKFLCLLGLALCIQFPGPACSQSATPVETENAPNPAVWQPGPVAHSGKFMFYKLPEVITSLAKSKNRAQYIKVHATLQLAAGEDVVMISSKLPLINDALTTCFHGISADRLSSSKGIDRIRGELQARINAILAPHKIMAVLFEQILTQ